MNNEIFWSEVGSGFGEPGCTPPPRILRSPPREIWNIPVDKFVKYPLHSLSLQDAGHHKACKYKRYDRVSLFWKNIPVIYYYAHALFINYQLPFQNGGLAVISPSEKARALKLRWLTHIGDLSCTSKWVFFARYWVGLALSRKVQNWTFLRSNICPKFIGDSPPKYFTHILTAVDRMNIDLTLLPNYRVIGIICLINITEWIQIWLLEG